MKNEEIILRLQQGLPKSVPWFSKNFSIVAMSIAGTTVTVQTSSNHELNPNDLVTVDGLSVPAEINAYSATATQIDCETATAHDLTLHPSEKKTVRISGATYDEVFKLKAVPNRNAFDIVLEGQPLFPAETLYLQQEISSSYNGLFQVLATPTTDTFTYEISEAFEAPNDFSTAQVATGHRISGAVDFPTIKASYTKQLENQLWCFVVVGDTIANKDRKNTNDALTQQGTQMDFYQQTIQGLSVYFFVPNKGDILTQTNGRAARDFIEDMKADILRSVLGINYKSSLSCQGQSVLTYIGDGFFEFNGSYYVHQFSFEQVLEITQGDTAIVADDRAFRDIDIMLMNQFSEITDYTACIDLDEQPEN